MYEHDEPSEGVPVVNLSSRKEDFFPDTSRDEEIAQKLLRYLNHGLLGPLDDDKLIILSNSNEEEEVHENDRADTKVAPSSAINSSALTVSVAADDDAPEEVQGGSSGDGTFDRVSDDSNDGGDGANTP
jgi:hypothetical protein